MVRGCGLVNAAAAAAHSNVKLWGQLGVRKLDSSISCDITIILTDDITTIC